MIEVPKWICDIIAIVIIILGILFNVCCVILNDFFKERRKR